MADGDMYNWMRSMDGCHAKHIGRPDALHQRIAYQAAYADHLAEGGWARFVRRMASFVSRKGANAQRAILRDASPGERNMALPDDAP